jgi:hypothetical protein
MCPPQSVNTVEILLSLKKELMEKPACDSDAINR